MAPRGRKNKVVKGTTVSAASRKWRVGDLVLAKVRGFPAWPARVTEPEKCGYSADWKKVLVCFFGTNEIAFLNPADVEAFTEEKKEALLAQRRGKSADFVRALQEIIGIFENPTNNSQLDDFNDIVEVIGTNLGNSDDSVLSSRLMNQSEGSPGTLNSGLNGSFNWGTFERSTCSDNVCTTAFSDRDALSEESIDNVVAATSTSNSKKNYELPQGSVSQTRALWSRKVASSKNLKMQSIDGNKSVINIVSKIVMDDSLMRNKIMTRLPEVSDVAISSACASLGETESMGSEGVTVDPEAHHYNKCSNPEFGGNHELIETVKGLGVDLVVGRIADFQNEHAVIKKKRKANRKREISELPELTAAPDKVADGDAELQKNAHDLPNIFKKSGGKFAKEVGDENLPLMKRARVRMENLSTSKEKLDHLIKMEDSSSKDAPLNVAVDTSINCGGDENRKSLMVKEGMVQPLPSNTGSQVTDNMPKESDNGKIQVSGSLDGEAAPPLSKRLHRSPEVLSAHVPEDDSACAETSMPNGGCVSFFLNYHHQSRETKANTMEERYEDSYGQSALKNQTSQYFVDVNLSMSEENKRPSVVSNNGTNYIKCSDSSKDDFEAEEGEIQATATYNFLQNLNGIPANFRFDQDSLDRLSPKDGKKCESIGRADSAEAAAYTIKESDTSRSTRISTTSVSGADTVTNVPPENDANTTLNYKTKDSAVRDSTKLMKISPDGCQIDGMCEAVTEDNSKSYKHTQRVDIWRTKHVPDASSPTYNDRLVKNYVSGIHSKPSSAYGTCFPITDPPLNASPLHMTNIGSNNFLKSNGYCSPEVHLHGHIKKSNNYPDVNEKNSGLAVTSSGRSNSVDTRDFLRSFETILSALTRKRESIGRATEIGIQCAKEGYAAKVLDTLIRGMENEQSLRKRLDLFFLMDSITQGCRSLKGDVRETFFAAIQSALPRVLLAAAPPGNTGRQNRRQCLQVLRLWLERRVLPKSVVQHHIRDINSLSYLPSSSAFSKRQHRNERAFDDPIREMGGLVDEYGSNSSIQIPDFCMPPTLNVEADRSDSDSGNFEAVTPEHNSVAREEPELTPMARMHRHVLKDVDNELDMDDVAPCIATNDVKNVASSHTSNYEHHMPSFLAPPLPDHEPPTFPPPSAVDLELYVGANVNYMQAELESGHLEVPSTIPPVISQSVNYRTPEFPNLQMETCLRGFTSYDRNLISPLPIGPMNFPPRRGGEVLYSKAYFQPPPSQRTPSSQFSYSQVNRQMQAGRNPALPQCNRFHFQPKLDGKAFHTGHHDRYIVPDFNERWRGSRSSFSGQFHPHDRDRPPSAPAPYMEGEPTRRRNHGLVCPLREMNYRNTMPIRTSLEAPRNWRQR